MKYSLGLDVSTQSISAVVLDIDSRAVVGEYSLDYCHDPRLNTFGIRQEDYILPPGTEGEASQPAVLFFAALDALFSDLKQEIHLADVAVINTSGQQHGHVYLNRQAPAVFGKLNESGSIQSGLAILLEQSLAWEAAPIWLTSNTGEQAAFIRDRAGGKERVIALSGADVPLRFTGVVIRRTGQTRPDVYRNTATIQLISNLIPAVLSANPGVPADYGNACGMALMDYRRKEWSDELLAAAGDGLPGGSEALRRKLPDLAAPDAVVGRMAVYFVEKYGFSPSCRIVAGSGDNPQSKVLVTGDLLSLGTSIVNMVSTDGETLDMNGYASAMYDGLGRPFMFGTRTNGVMVWDRLRGMYGLEKNDYAAAEAALENTPPARNMLFWQPRNESFPPSGPVDITRIGDDSPSLGTDYGALIETTLAFVYHYSKGFTRDTVSPLFVTGGARRSREILRRIAAIWDRPVIPIEAGGAALGAAVAGACGLLKAQGRGTEADGYVSEGLLKTGDIIHPRAEDVTAFHGGRGFLERFAGEQVKVTG